MTLRYAIEIGASMLAKQCQRLIDNYESLCARVLRSKYYPSGDISNCQLSSRKDDLMSGRASGQEFKHSEKGVFGELAMA